MNGNKSTEVTVDHREIEKLAGLLRRVGVVHFEIGDSGSMKMVLGPLPSDAPTAPDTRRQPQDALSAALDLRGTRSEPETEHKGDAK